jgi:anti-sigma B factor antagonist
MKVRVRTNQLIHIIDIEGDMELFDSNLLKELVMKMIEKKADRFIINVNKIKSIDSSGIGAFIFISSTLKKMGMDLAITNVNGAVKQVIEKTKLTSYFPIYENLETAIQQLSK